MRHVLHITALLMFTAGVATAQAPRPSAGTGEVVAIRPVTLKNGVDAAGFERFARQTYNPAWEHIVPGMRVVLVKADRGEQKGRYALVFLFDSANTRDAYFPQEGSEGTETFQAYLKPVQDLETALMEYVAEVGAYTDFVALR